MVAENMTVLPAVMTVRRTAVGGVSYPPSAISSRKRLTMNSP